MAIVPLPSTTESWGRWPHAHQPATDHNMMDATMMPYDGRTAATAHVPRPDLAQQFVPGPFTAAPVPSVPSPASPQYHAPVSPVTYHHGYTPYSHSPMPDAPFKSPECLERMQPRVLPAEPSVDGGAQESSDALALVKRSRSPSIKSEARSPPALDAPSPEPVTPSDGVREEAPIQQCATPIDTLAKIIEEKLEILGVPEQAEPGVEGPKGKGKATKRSRAKVVKPKRFYCDVDGCSKVFAQKNNLETHRRSHTGEKPFPCPYCPRRFTQGANLNSHINRHIGVTPYKCPQCPKMFSQASNVNAHKKTHIRRELRAHWVCRFGKCQKSFTAKGNLKNHQNTYHEEEIEAFKAKLANLADESSISEEEKEMAKYIIDVHNLANKGIKGRGKGCKVKRVTLLHPPYPQHHQQQQYPSPESSPISTPAIVHTAASYPITLLAHGLPIVPPSPQDQQSAAAAAYHNHQGYYGLSSPVAYGVPTGPAPNMVFGGPLTHHGPYGMLDSDQMSDASSVHDSSSLVIHLDFGGRMY